MSDHIRLFISHSSADLEFVNLLVKLLQKALNLSNRDIRCTSLDGYRLPGGAYISQQLRNEIASSEAFIGIISVASLESIYVVFELGARWGMLKPLVPLLTPGTPFKILGGPMSEINSLRGDNESQLRQLINDLAKTLGIISVIPSYYRDELINVLSINSSKELEILNAKYGSQNHRIDVTNYLNMQIKDNELHEYVGNQYGDPTPGTKKDLVVKYQYKGIEKTKVVEEREELNLP
jgi:hypothetical protein